jgi:hypothetical protein
VLFIHQAVRNGEFATPYQGSEPGITGRTRRRSLQRAYRIIEDDRYPLSPRIMTLKAIRPYQTIAPPIYPSLILV